MTAATVPERPSPWRTPFAIRTYVSGAFWLAGIALQALAGAEDSPGWLAVRLDPAGLLFAAASLIGGLNFFGAGLRAAKRLRLDMNFLMSLAIVAAILIGEPFEAASLAFLFAMAELLERFAVDRSRRSVAELLRLAGFEEGKRRSHRSGSNPYRIASRVSTHREAVTRELARLSRDGLVKRDKGALVVTNLDRLAELVHTVTGE